MLDAKLINNTPHCPSCDIPLSNIQEYGMVEYKGRAYLQFIRRCNNCNESVQYVVENIGEDRFVFPNDDIKRVKEEVRKVSEE